VSTDVAGDGRAAAGGSVGIVELVAVCDQLAAADRRRFERLGRWVTEDDDLTRRRFWATAAHRHAWHAELWDERSPAIRRDGAPVGSDGSADDGSARPDAGAYRAELTATRSQLDALRARVDPELDPSTRRVVDLVDADLADLLARLDALTG
jgi:hypothetical protein